MTQEQKPPPGVLVLIVSGDGRVLATGADFDPGPAAGFSLREAQERRATMFANAEFFEVMCSPLIPAAMDHYARAQVINKLRGDGKITVTVLPIGHEDQ